MLSESLMVNTTLASVNLGCTYCDFPFVSFQKKMSLTVNYISVEGAVKISEALKTNTTLMELNVESEAVHKTYEKSENYISLFAGNVLKVEGAVKIGEALKTNPSLTKLNLKCLSIYIGILLYTTLLSKICPA